MYYIKNIIRKNDVKDINEKIREKGSLDIKKKNCGR